MGFLLHLLRMGDTFVDVGADAGSFTILSSAIVKCKTISIEPIPDTFKRLQLNIQLNNISTRVEALNLGLSDVIGAMRFTKNLDCMNHAIDDENLRNLCEETISVDVSTLDSDLMGRNVHLIKVDVEGYEIPVLRGSLEALKNDSLLAIILEVNSSAVLYGHGYVEIFKILNSMDYVSYSYDPLNRHLTKIDVIDVLGGNIIFIKNIKLVQERLRTSRHYNVNGTII